MTDQARTPTTESIVAEIDALAIEYPDFDHAPFAIVGQGLLRRIRAALLAAEQREQVLREALTEVCVRIEASITSQAETHRELSTHRKRVLDAVYAVAESALAASSEPPATGDQPPTGKIPKGMPD